MPKFTQINFTCKHCRGSGSISHPSDYKKSILTSRPERCAIVCKSATYICRNTYIYIYLYIYIYIFKKTQHSAFFCKRTKRSLRSFTFFAKERYVLCKRTLHSLQKNVVFFKRTENNDAFRTEKNAVPNPAKLRHASSFWNVSLSVNVKPNVYITSQQYSPASVHSRQNAKKN